MVVTWIGNGSDSRGMSACLARFKSMKSSSAPESIRADNGSDSVPNWRVAGSDTQGDVGSVTGVGLTSVPTLTNEPPLLGVQDS